jgi:hypothetical protein
MAGQFLKPSETLSDFSPIGSDANMDPRIMQYALKLQFQDAPSGTFSSRDPNGVKMKF